MNLLINVALSDENDPRTLVEVAVEGKDVTLDEIRPLVAEAAERAIRAATL